MTTSKIRLWTAASLTLLPTLILVIARFAWGDRLPETVASHWSGSTPDGFSTTTTFFAIALVISLVAVVCACVVAARSSDNAPLFLAVSSISSATLATIWILSVALTIDAGSPEAARIGWWILAPIAAVLVGVLAYALPDQQRSGPESPLPTPTLDTPLTASERAVWVGQVRSVWPWIVTAYRSSRDRDCRVLGLVGCRDPGCVHPRRHSIRVGHRARRPSRCRHQFLGRSMEEDPHLEGEVRIGRRDTSSRMGRMGLPNDTARNSRHSPLG